MKLTINESPRKNITVEDLKPGQFAICVGHTSGYSAANGDIVFRSHYKGTYIIYSEDKSVIGSEFSNGHHLFELIEPQEFIFNKV